MSSEPRITVEVPDPNNPQQINVYLNPAGVEQLIADLRRLSEDHDHFHLFSEEWGGYDLSTEKYDSSSASVNHMKVMLRLDEWDEKYFPHVMPEKKP